MAITKIEATPATEVAPEAKKICGIVMPISSMDGCTEVHWGEVLNIINQAIDESGFEGNW